MIARVAANEDDRFHDRAVVHDHRPGRGGRRLRLPFVGLATKIPHLILLGHRQDAHELPLVQIQRSLVAQDLRDLRFGHRAGGVLGEQFAIDGAKLAPTGDLLAGKRLAHHGAEFLRIGFLQEFRQLLRRLGGELGIRDLRDRVVRPEQRVGGLGPAIQIRLPASEDDREQLALGGEGTGIGGLEAADIARGPQIAGEGGRGFQFAEVVASQFVGDRLRRRLAFFQLIVKRLGLGCLGGTGQQGEILRLDAGAEHPVERVIILRRDRVVLVIVAAGTGDGEGLKSPEGDIQPVVDDVGLTVEVAPADREETHGRQRPFVGIRQLVGGQLLKNELIVRDIFIERTNQPVAIRVRIGVIAILLEDVALRVGIAGDVHPVAGLMLAVSR